MRKVTEYREHARECRKLAALMAEPESRAQLLNIADSWDQLADERERLVHLHEEPILDRP
jgi:uncharacterized protein YjiS (DUF1127 family)